MPEVLFHATRCAICDTEGNATEVYPANFDQAALNPEIFSARRLPDRIHYRMVRCHTCGLVRSDPVAETALLARLYAESTFDYGTEVDNLKWTYGRYLAKLGKHGARKDSLLEIGCGNGFFLEEAAAQGYRKVTGVEPSSDAVAGAERSIRSNLVCDIMRPGLFAPETFDVICMFQVFDHIPNPVELLEECRRVLKPGGVVLCLNHNIDSVSARLFKERSPIIDIEHTYLYSPATLGKLFTAHGFEVTETGSVSNTYSATYLARLVPLPPAVKTPMLRFLEQHSVGRTRLSVALGNLYLIAGKPAHELQTDERSRGGDGT
jgi:SAM-dependent methyltransferase